MAAHDDDDRRRSMMREGARDAQMLLAADAVACAVSAGLATTSVADELVDLGGHKVTVASALAGTAGVLAAGATRPTRTRLATAALVNAGWVVAGACALPRQTSRRGRLVVAAIAAGDAAAGGLQWILRSRI